MFFPSKKNFETRNALNFALQAHNIELIISVVIYI